MIKVLIAEDDSVSSKILERYMTKWGYKIVITKNGEEAWQVIQDDKKISLAILDWMMPEIEGVELCRKIRQEKKEKYLYIILLTSKDRQEDIIEGFNAGADDYITKPFKYLELKARLKTGKRIIELTNKLESLANRDSLTKLWNRRRMLRILEKEIHRSHRENKPVAIIMLDIDNFKKINDTYGHLCGDSVLQEISSRLKKNTRKYDEIGRYGGDELLMILPNCTLSNVKKIAERLRHFVCDRKIKTETGPMSVTISIGAVSTETIPDISAEELIKASDNALYKAKNKGRNCIVTN